MENSERVQLAEIALLEMENEACVFTTLIHTGPQYRIIGIIEAHHTNKFTFRSEEKIQFCLSFRPIHVD